MRRLLILYFSAVLVGATEINRAAVVAEINPVFPYAGVGCGRHATYKEMCVIDLAR